MKTITKKYKIYKFHELSKKRQNELIEFRLRSDCHNHMMANSGKMPSLKFLKALYPYEKKELKKFSFFKNGNYAFIPEGE